ncbi:MAG: hypothetical protein EFT35_09220 [Methanophagales archaeon ANME-1-THS]|nr:MAG: hypothetical protein EFT35_09220 [Methanophagales archaeon ANME-1-THS]
MSEEEKPKKVEPIYEKILPGEILIISKEEKCITYVINENGKPVIGKVCLPEEETEKVRITP